MNMDSLYRKEVNHNSLVWASEGDRGFHTVIICILKYYIYIQFILRFGLINAHLHGACQRKCAFALEAPPKL